MVASVFFTYEVGQYISLVTMVYPLLYIIIISMQSHLIHNYNHNYACLLGSYFIIDVLGEDDEDELFPDDGDGL